MKSGKILLLVLAASLLSACATSTFRSPGAEVEPVSRLAVLEYNGELGAEGVNIVEVDSKHRGIGFFRRYELIPGERSLKVLLNINAVVSKPIFLNFKAETGQSYELKYEVRRTDFKGGTWRVWIEDKQSGKPLVSTQG